MCGIIYSTGFASVVCQKRTWPSQCVKGNPCSLNLIEIIRICMKKPRKGHRTPCLFWTNCSRVTGDGRNGNHGNESLSKSCQCGFTSLTPPTPVFRSVIMRNSSECKTSSTWFLIRSSDPTTIVVACGRHFKLCLCLFPGSLPHGIMNQKVHVF